MTITANDSRNEYTASAAQTVFNYTFRIYTANDLNVFVTQAGQECSASDLTTDYVVDTGTIDDPAGGFITLNVGASAGDLITINSSITQNRTTDYQTNGDFIPATVNADFDRVVSLVKQLETDVKRAPRYLECSQGTESIDLPSPEAGRLIRYNGDASAFENVDSASLGGDVILTQDLMLTKETVAAMTADASIVVGQFIGALNYTTTNNSGVLFFKAVAGAASAPDGGSQIDHDTLAIHLVQNFPRNISWKAFGAEGNGVRTNEHVEIQACLDYSKTVNKPCYGPAGTYLCNSEIKHETQDLFNSRPDNGITFIGDGIGRTILQAEDTFSGSLLVLDGNPDDISDVSNSVVQVSNFIGGFSLVGNGQFSGNPLSNGMRIRANQRCHFGQMMIKEWTQHGLFIDGTTVATKDDADTTQQCSFKDFHVHECNSFGVYAPNSRTSTLSFDTCEIRNNTNDGFRMGYSGLRLKNVSFVGNGQAGNSTGGFTTIVPVTGAISRGLVILGCESENNFNHEIRLDYCDGFSITGSRFGAFKNNVGAGGQRVFKLGDASGTSVVRGDISGNQIANLGNVGGFGHTVFVYDCEDECDGVSINNVGIGNNYTDFTMTSGVKGITRNGAELTTTPSKPGFSVTMAPNATDIANVTGDGTVFTAAALHGSATITEYYNSGDYSTGVFTAPEQGMYNFNLRWPCSGFDGTETSA